jgi:hypothetical protein
MLGPCFSAYDSYACGYVDCPDACLHLVDVLAAVASAPEGLKAYKLLREVGALPLLEYAYIYEPVLTFVIWPERAFYNPFYTNKKRPYTSSV